MSTSKFYMLGLFSIHLRSWNFAHKTDKMWFSALTESGKSGWGNVLANSEDLLFTYNPPNMTLNQHNCMNSGYHLINTWSHRTLPRAKEINEKLE